ncbi:MAG: hypothetical protein ACI4JD_06740 [Ruminococcus sp.]
MCGTENRPVNVPVFEKNEPATSEYDTYEDKQTDYFSHSSQGTGSASRIDFKKQKWFLPSMLGVLVLILAGIVTAIVIMCFGGGGSGSSSPEGAVEDAITALNEGDYETLMEKCIPDDYFSSIEDAYGIDVKQLYNSFSGAGSIYKANANIDYRIKSIKQAGSSKFKRFKKYFVYNDIPGMNLNAEKITDLVYVDVEFVEYGSNGKVIDEETTTLEVYKYDGKWYVYQLKEISILE